MWLVSGIDEEHRFPDWRDAAAFYRQIVGDWVAAHGDPGTDVREDVLGDLRQGGTHEVEFPAGDDGRPARFRLSWDARGGRTDHFVAC
ncbi:hypothetical protein [Pseudonocardia zijingensis]|jgi:hypothetical protein|uniref:Glyoxalase-like domain-containing protein n=1 Tax=Pseudonocardia zijingensis TaxID=153376 RepID=A0ABN1P4T4_9PSEU